MGDERPAPRLRAADPANPRRTDTRPAGTVLAVVVATLSLSALLNADVMLRRAETSELGGRRDIALAFWEPVHSVSSALGLTRPRAGLDAIRELDDTGSPSTRIVAAGDTDDEEDGGQTDMELAASPGEDAPGQDGDGEPVAGTLGHSPASAGPDSTSGPTPAGSEPSTSPTSGPADDAAPEGPTATGRSTGSEPGGDGSRSEKSTAPHRPEGPTEPGDGAVGADAAVEPDVALRTPTAEDPLRVLVIGDSTLDPVGAALLRDLGQTGVAAGVVDYRVSTGLSRPDFFDWPAHLRQLRPQLRPEVYVIMLGANDAQAFVVDNRAVEFGTEEWLAVYRARVSALLDQLTADGAWVIWIGQPAMRNDDFDTKMRLLNQLYAEEIGRVPTARFVDSRVLTVDDDDRYAAYLLDGNGDRFQVRQTDGIHLTPAGGDRLAPSVIAVIDHIAPLRP